MVADDRLLIDRRMLLAATGLLAAGRAAATPSQGSVLGSWSEDADGLPQYRYTGPLRFAKPMLPDDPWFLLGNHRLTAFVHASGRLRWRSGERGWAALNGRDGLHDAAITIDGVSTPLIGLNAAAAHDATRTFGVGHAEYSYALSDMTVRRKLAIAPSVAVGDGPAAIVVVVEITNHGVARDIAYTERLGAKYEPIAPPWAKGPDVGWHTVAAVDAEGRTACARTRPRSAAPFDLPRRPRASRFDTDPPDFWISAVSGCSATADDGIGVVAHLRLAAGARGTLRFVIGHSFATDTREPSRIADGLVSGLRDGTFADRWRALIPPFASEIDPVLRREMQWHVGTLEAMATWLNYYDETVIPQGTTYDYEWGILDASRDLAQHALPLCTLRPPLARSVLRYLFKITAPDGDVKLSTTGYGWVPSGAMQTSDQQLYLFLLLAEYLRTTGDGSILAEPVGWEPLDAGAAATGLEHLTRAFTFLRDRIGVGAHGLIKLWNSDWNDMFFFWPTTAPYNQLFDSGESHMNTAMALSVFADLADQLARFPATAPLVSALRAYRGMLATAFLADLGSRTFPRRAYFGTAGAIGETAMWLEPQGYALLTPDLPELRRRSLWSEVQHRLLRGEALGPRQIETGAAQGDLAFGQRENGGFWYALTGPVVLGVARFDPAAARALLQMQTLDAYARRFPEYWTGHWSASDSLDASPARSPGLSANGPWCAHAHAWPLYLYLRLRP